jgi:uncharacterized metal-binding protein YceD (DUF177 family)
MAKASQLAIFVDRLREQGAETVACTLPGAFMEIEEPALAFRDPINVHGEVYLAEEYAVFHGDASTLASIPCSICNEWVRTPVAVTDFNHAEPIENAVKGMIDFGPIVRDALLVEVPQYVECSGGNCPHRAELSSFLKHEKHASPNPFKDL